jgi:hypothetical protein
MRKDREIDEPPAPEPFVTLGDRTTEPLLLIEEIEEAWSALPRDSDEDHL